MLNTFLLTHTIVEGDKFLEWTGNKYAFVSQRPYIDKKGKTGINGVNLTLRILEDHGDYGVDKDGNPRNNNRGQNFECTILNGKTELPLEFGDIVTLEGFDEEHSYSINFDLLMRFRGVKRLAKAGGGNAGQSEG